MRIESLDVGDLDKWVEAPPLAGSVRPLADFADEIIAKFAADQTVTGRQLPWAKTQRLFRLRSHELTVWGGENGTWKSTLLSQVLLDLSMQGSSVLLVPLEETAADVGKRMVQQACCREHPNPKAVRDLLNGTRDRLLILNVQGRIRAREAIALLRWAAIERQIQHIALDNLTKIVSVSNEAMAEQQQFISDAHGVALDTGAHVHVVAHVRKPAGDDRPGRYDLRGSSTISDQADNVLMLWRNRPKELAIEEGKDTPATREEPDLVLRVTKQRHGSFEGNIQLWKHSVSRQFVPDGITPPVPYAFEYGVAQ